LSEFLIDYSKLRGGAYSSIPHGNYQFTVVAMSKNFKSDDSYRFIHLKSVNLRNDSVVDCNPFWNKDNFLKKVDSIRSSVAIHGVSGSLKDIGTGLLISTATWYSAKMPAWLGGKAVATLVPTKVATIVAGAAPVKFTGVVLGATIKTTALISGPTAVLSRAAYGEWIEQEKGEWWDLRRYFPALFSKNLSIDVALDEHTLHCREISYIKGEGQPSELMFNVKKVEFIDDNKSVKLYFTIELMKLHNGKNSTYYQSLPN
jgi:hypothetical protein